MHVDYLAAEGEGSNIEKKDPSWQQIESVIFALNGYELSLLTLGLNYKSGSLQGETQEFMYVAGGGKNQLYLCGFYSYEDSYGKDRENELFLFDLSKVNSGKEEIEITNIFLDYYPPERGVTVEKVLKATNTYYHSGSLDKLLNWGYYSRKKAQKSEIILL